MKINRNRKGQYSITEMTADDLNNLMFAAGTAETWYWQNGPTVHANDRQGWVDQRKGAFGRLERVLRDFYFYNGRREARTVEIVSDSYEARQVDTSYQAPAPVEDDGPAPFEAVGLLMVQV